MFTRRSTLALALAALPLRAAAQSAEPFAATADRARGLDQLHGLLIAIDGQPRLAEAFRGPALNRVVNVKSVSKTLVAALTGAAIDRGALPGGTEARLGDLAPRLIPRDADPRVAELTVADLLTMQAGLESTSGPRYGEWVSSRNWVADALSRPMIREPGEGMIYSTGSFHVLGAALSVATGRTLLSLARDWIGAPLGIDIAPWTRDPQGYYMGGNNMGLSPRGLLAFGEAFRTGEGLVSADWIRRSWTARTRSPFSGDDYGYGWFLTEAAGHPVRYARGYGGQMLYVLPDLRMTVVVTSDETRPARSGGHVGDLNRMLAEEIIPAAERLI